MPESAESEGRLPRLKLSLRPTAESIVRGGHPWVYSESIRKQNREGEAGEIAVIYDRKDKFLALGFYDPDSPLRVRILHVGKPVKLDHVWWEEKLAETLAIRAPLLSESTNGLRLINGESDGWPGLVMDRYGATLVLKLYTSAWMGLLDLLGPMIVAHLSPERIVLRMSRNLQSWVSKNGGPGDGELLHGPEPGGVVVFLENGLRFESDVLRGQKTGFFLDQRENRQQVGELSEGRDVLNAFSFSGGFSLYAARGGAKSVTDLDISGHALAAAGRNFALNKDDPKVVACRHEVIKDDVFQWVEKAGSASFDLVVMDPPSLAKREAERGRAIEAYAKLNAQAIRLLRPGGVLVAASCSAHVSEDEFFHAVRSTAKRSGRSFEELGTRLHAPDHRAIFPEAQYLKCIFLQFAK